MQYSLTVCLTALAAWTVSAYTPANYDLQPGGNAILRPGLNELVEAGQPYDIVWEPTNGDFITLVLLKGPAENMILVSSIAEVIPNTGSYRWDGVPSDLQTQPTGYGIQLIVEGTGAYQYSTQFGISNGVDVDDSHDDGSEDDGSEDDNTDYATTMTGDYDTVIAIPTTTSTASYEDVHMDISNDTVTLLPISTEEAAEAEETHPTTSEEMASMTSIYYAPTMSVDNSNMTIGNENATGTMGIVMATGAASSVRGGLDGAAVMAVAGVAAAVFAF